jgi:uncharacterized protein (DUF4415 family)
MSRPRTKDTSAAPKSPQEKTHEETFARVRYVVNELKAEGLLPKEATARKRVIEVRMHKIFGQGVSYATLYKEEYRALWHPLYEDGAPNIIPDQQVERDRIRNAKLVKQKARTKAINIKIDTDVLQWFKEHANNKAYQTLINDVLRTYVEHNKGR